MGFYGVEVQTEWEDLGSRSAPAPPQLLDTSPVVGLGLPPHEVVGNFPTHRMGGLGI